MKKFTLIIAGCLLAILHLNAQTEQDKEGVNRALLDYIEGFYDGDSSKIIRSISPDVVKYGYFKDRATGIYKGEPMSYKEMIDYAVKTGVSRKNGKQLPASVPKKTEIYEVLDQTASGKITAWWGTDYVLLEKKNDRWMIRMVLWQGPLKR
jgi:Putative lumazine-binding